MKKLAVLSIALLMLASLVFAEVMVEPKVAFSGSGTLSWGIDLDTTADSGFLNETAVNLTVTFIAASTETKGGAEGDMVYGYIGLKDMALVLNTDNNKDLPADMAEKATTVDLDGDAAVADTYVTAPDGDTISVPTAFLTPPTVEAYVVLGPAKWFIYAAPDLAISYAAAVEDESADDDVNYWAEDEETNGITTDATGDFGAGATGVEFAAGPVTITGLIASAGDWTVAGSYGAAAKVALVLGPATIKAGFNFPFTAATPGFGGSIGLTAGPIAVNAGFDGVASSGVFNYEVAGGLTLTLPDVLTLTANAAMGDVWNLDAEVGATLTAVPNLNFAANLGLWDLVGTTSALEWGVKVDAGYKVAMGDVNYIKPNVTAYISQENATGSTLRVVIIGSLTAVLIPNTTFTVTYTDKDLTDSTDFAGTDRLLTIATKVAY